MVDTSIRVSEELADELWGLKNRGDSYEDVIWRLIEQTEGGDTPAGRETAVEAVEDRADAEPIESPPAHEATQQPARDATADEPAETAEPIPTDVGVDREQLRDALPGSGQILEARVDAIVAMYEYLRAHGTAEKSDLLALVDADVVGYASPDSVWANMVKGKETLRALPGVETPPTGRTEWRYTAEDGDGGGIYDPTEEF